LNAQEFQASFSNTGNQISFKIRPTADINTGFSIIEFIVRSPEAAPDYTFGPVVENTTNFPGMTEFIVEDQGVIDGYDVTRFYYTGPAPATTPRAYTSGVEYEVFTVKLIGDPAETIDLQLVQSDDDDPFYFSIWSQGGTSLRAAVTNVFYPTIDISGDPYFYQLSSIPLPVKWLSFSAQRDNANALLHWSVTNENNTSHFEVERSENGRNFTSIGKINAMGGTSSQINRYEFTDPNITSRSKPIFHYRIRQVDKDQKKNYSIIKSLRIDQKATLVTMFPNPANNKTVITLDIPFNERVLISIIDSRGRVVRTQHVNFIKGLNQHTLDVLSLAKGSYDVTLRSENIIQSLKLVRQ
jgi:hypothetical protein